MADYKNKEQLSNIQEMLLAIIENGPVSKKELQKITGFSWGFVSEKSNLLMENKYICSSIRNTQSVGRKTEELDINPSANYFIGTEISYKKINMILTDMKGRIIEQKTEEFEQDDRTKENFFTTLFFFLDYMFKKYSKRKINGIGLAVQGLVNRNAGMAILNSKIKGWNDVPLEEILEERYGVDVIVEHDSDCHMKSEMLYGQLKKMHSEDAIMITISHAVGIGTSMMIDGNIHRGSKNISGEIGRKVIGVDQNNQYVFLEEQVTREGIIKEYYKRTNIKKRFSQIEQEGLDGVEEGKSVFDDLAKNVALAVSDVNNIINPEVIIINTRECKCQSLFFDKIKEVVNTISYNKSVQIILSDLDNNAMAVGAAFYAIENTLHKL